MTDSAPEHQNARLAVLIDSDFTRLATRLRESGKTVFGLGRRRTPTSLQNACDRFIFLDVLQGAGGAPKDDSDTEETPPLPDLKGLLTSAVESISQDDGWVPLSALGSYLTKTNASFDPRNYQHTKLSSLVRAQDYLEVEQRDGRSLHVRLRPQQTRKAAATTSSRRSRKSAQKAPAKQA